MVAFVLCAEDADATARMPKTSKGFSLKEVGNPDRQRNEGQYLRLLLARTGGNISLAANRRTRYNKMEAYGLPRRISVAGREGDAV